MQTCPEKLRETIPVQAEMRELTENAWVSREMRETSVRPGRQSQSRKSSAEKRCRSRILVEPKMENVWASRAEPENFWRHNFLTAFFSQLLIDFYGT